MKIMGLLLMSLSPAAFAAVGAVPEPSTLSLFAAAAVGAGIAVRLAKRSRK